MPLIICNPYIAASTGGVDPNTVLLIHSDTTNGSTTFTDSSSSTHTINIDNGTPTHSTTQAKFGATSISLTTSDQLAIPNSTDFQFDTGAFTVDGWFYYTGGAPVPLSYGTNWMLHFQPIIYFAINDAWSWGAGTMSTNVWTHVAAVRDDSSNLYIFKDGVLQNSWTGVSGNIGDAGVPLHIGYSDEYTRDFTGYIDELRIQKGVAAWTSNFTPPSTPY